MKQIDFQLPPDWSAPAGKKQGDRVEGFYQIELKGGNRACLVSLDGSYFPGYTDPDGDQPEKGQSPYKPGMEAPPGMQNAMGSNNEYMQSGG